MEIGHIILGRPWQYDTCKYEAPEEQDEENHEGIKAMSMARKYKEEFSRIKTRGRIRVLEEEIKGIKQVELLMEDHV